jgi:hypothetical protein
MHYGVSVPNFGDYSDLRLLAELAREAEMAGWDGLLNELNEVLAA